MSEQKDQMIAMLIKQLGESAEDKKDMQKQLAKMNDQIVSLSNKVNSAPVGTQNRKIALSQLKDLIGDNIEFKQKNDTKRHIDIAIDKIFQYAKHINF